MLPGFSRKTICNVLCIVAAVSLTAFVSARATRRENPPAPPKPQIVRVPVQVIQSDDQPRTIYVDFEMEAVPEPSSLVLLPFSAFLLMRRRR